MLISLTEYAKINNRSARTIRNKCERNGFKTAKKIGRNWVIEDKEQMIDLRYKKNRK